MRREHHSCQGDQFGYHADRKDVYVTVQRQRHEYQRSHGAISIYVMPTTTTKLLNQHSNQHQLAFPSTAPQQQRGGCDWEYSCVPLKMEETLCQVHSVFQGKCVHSCLNFEELVLFTVETNSAVQAIQHGNCCQGNVDTGCCLGRKERRPTARSAQTGRSSIHAAKHLLRTKPMQYFVNAKNVK